LGNKPVLPAARLEVLRALLLLLELLVPEPLPLEVMGARLLELVVPAPLEPLRATFAFVLDVEMVLEASLALVQDPEMELEASSALVRDPEMELEASLALVLDPETTELEVSALLGMEVLSGTCFLLRVARLFLGRASLASLVSLPWYVTWTLLSPKHAKIALSGPTATLTKGLCMSSTVTPQSCL
jgi:hypothetical protein